MKIKSILLAVVVLATVLVGWMFLKNNREVLINSPTPTISPTPTPLVSPELLVSPSPVVSKNIVIYTDSGYTPNTIKIKKGETVTWKNKSSGGMWTASNPHPIHTEYPQSGGCISSIFDECKSDGPGIEWSFTFTHAGTWGYHNHVNARDMGTVVVE